MHTPSSPNSDFHTTRSRISRFIPLAFALFVHTVTTFAQAPNTAPAELPVIARLPATDDGLPGAGPIRRYDWFRKLWAERRVQWSKQVEQDRGAVVFLGDSITQMWGDNLGNSFAGMKVANRGISGDTTRGVLIRLKEDVLDVQPSAVVLLIGTNDLDEKAEPETIAGNMKLILAALKSHNAAMPIILCQVFPSSESKNRPSAKIKKLNQLYAAAVKGDPQITFIETWPLFANAQGDAKPEEFPDLLHPNETGYTKWAAALRPIFATLGFLETTDDDFTPEPGFISLFNGRDLTGWGFRPSSDADIRSRANWQRSDTNAPPWPIITEPTGFDGKTASPEGRFVAKHGRLIVTTPAEGRKIQQLYTTRQFSNDFVLKLEFRATPNADSGVYIRGPQLQCRDYLIAGPYKQLKQYKPQDWNEMIVTVTNGIAFSTCNGEVLEAAMKVPPVGPIGVEGDRGQMEYRRIRVKLLP
ncbi:MAG TPA: GDSL-type esterase/lipase family protein [Verrucomicrobiae bacterium]|nr:GDSL-type esterase/lipase family protein [Verrucomicrobiae bacterium]